MRFRRLILFSLALSGSLAVPPVGQAQNNCKAFRAVIQANWMDVTLAAGSQLLPVIQAAWTDPKSLIPPPPANVFGWAGPFVGTLDGQLVFGYYSSWLSSAPTQTGVVGKEGEVNSRLDFGADGYLITVSDNKGVFPLPPGHDGFGAYAESSKVAQGQGTVKFLNASGNVSYSGSWIWYPTTSDSSPTAPGSGIWHAEINGKLCNVP